MPRSKSRSDVAFRIGTGAFGLLLIALVCGIGVVLAYQSLPSIQKFGLSSEMKIAMPSAIGVAIVSASTEE